MSRLLSAGTTVRATTSEATRAKATVRENGAKTWPMRPPTKAIGRTTATVAMVEPRMARPTSAVPWTTASRRFSPSWMCR
jgi:hypothetical protein